MRTLYLAGGLFNAAERLHNLYLEKHLKPYGYNILLPQREAVQFSEDDVFDGDAIMEDCHASCWSPENLYVGCIDGADADGGTAVEYGIAISITGRAVVYRTDFRTATDKELGYNAMFRIKGTTFIYYPCYFTELDQADAYYAELARRIHEGIQGLSS